MKNAKPTRRPYYIEYTPWGSPTIIYTVTADRPRAALVYADRFITQACGDRVTLYDGNGTPIAHALCYSVCADMVICQYGRDNMALVYPDIAPLTDREKQRAVDLGAVI